MRIKEVLKENGYTQQMLADKMNVSLSAVKQMVSAGSLTTSTLEKIASALNVAALCISQRSTAKDRRSFPHLSPLR